MWLRFPRQAWTAKKFALIDRTLGSDDAMKLGILHGTPQPKTAIAAPVRRDRGIAVEDVMPQLRGITAGQVSVESAHPQPPAQEWSATAAEDPAANGTRPAPPAFPIQGGVG
jgi:hypothetical protein